jgi:hypothetical protein
VSDRILSESMMTRKVLRAELVDNPNNPNAAVRIAIIHQRKKKEDEWQDVPAEPLTRLKAGEQAKMSFTTSETLRLFEELQALSKIYSEKGILWGTKKVIVGIDTEVLKLSPERKKVIQALLDQNHSNEVWEEIVEKQPNLATKLGLARLQCERAKALAEFDTSLRDNRNEGYWQQFFERNTWIFGYGLRYQFLHTIQPQPHYGGSAVTGKGGERGDYLTASSGAMRFTVLVEIKKPTTELLCNKEYRNGVLAPSDELAGAISQLQINCRKWELEGAGLEQNVEILRDVNIYTISPKGILVVGSTHQLVDNDRRNSFELLRRNTINPEVLTFDELHQRAQYIVQQSSPEAPIQTPTQPDDDVDSPRFNDDDIQSCSAQDLRRAGRVI